MDSFGRAWLAQWMLAPGSIYLNHGTVGATPRRVLARQQALRDEMESRPSSFLLREIVGMVGTSPCRPGRVREAAAVVAELVHAAPSDLGFVTNVTAGINAVLRSLDLRDGDEIVVLSHAYGAIVNAARAICRGAAVREAVLPARLSDPAQAVEAVERAITPRTRLAILDHITSSSALLLPIAEMTRAAQRRGVAVLVDGAHAPGAVPVDVAAIGAEWYAANLHKWAWSPRSCGFLHARADLHRGLHAPTISWGLDQGLAAEFDWQGTHDPTPMLAAPEGIAMLRELGAERVQRHNHDLAWRAALALRDELGAEPLGPESMVGTMVTVALPERMGSTQEAAVQLRDQLLFDERIEVQLHAYQGQLHLRVSGQIYNDDSDIQALLVALRARQG